MGFGGTLAMGCTVGQAITGVSTLALGSLLTAVAIGSIFGAGETAEKSVEWLVNNLELREAADVVRAEGGGLLLGALTAGFVLLVLAAVMTIWSMVVYLRAAWPFIMAGDAPGAGLAGRRL